MAEPQPLRLISETKFDHRVPDGLPKSNPTVDLSVTWDAAARNLLIYRPRDQVVSKIHQYARPGTTAPEPLALKWKPDGRASQSSELTGKLLTVDKVNFSPSAGAMATSG